MTIYGEFIEALIERDRVKWECRYKVFQDGAVSSSFDTFFELFFYLI
jgi:hypothetical protein